MSAASLTRLAGTRPERRRNARAARPKVAVDIVLFAIMHERPVCYLVQLGHGPSRGAWAFPGRLVQVGELLDTAARSEVETVTGLSDIYLEQLFTFGDPHRDPRAHVVSVAYLGLTHAPEVAVAVPKHYPAALWFPLDSLPRFAYDHATIAEYAARRLRSKLEYTNIAQSLLPPAFTFAELEGVYSALLTRKLDRRNFRRRVLATGLLREVGVSRRGAHRPAVLYEFVQRSLQTIEML